MNIKKMVPAKNVLASTGFLLFKEKVRKRAIHLNVFSLVTVVTAWWLHPPYGDNQLFIVLFGLCCPGNSCVLLNL